MRGKLVAALGALTLLAAAGTAAAGGFGSGDPRRLATVSAQPASRQHRPLLAVVGASFSAGVGAGRRRAAWPEDLARLLDWRLIVAADPGAGYINPGDRDLGPLSRLAARLDLGRRTPRVIIIQGGHDDIGRPLPLIHQRVTSLVDEVHAEAPHAVLVLLTVFSRGNRPSGAAHATDRTIVAAARTADPRVVIFDPLTEHWHFPHIADHLHPSPAGHRWIARRLAAGLRRLGDGVHGKSLRIGE